MITKSGAERVLVADTIATDAIPKLEGTKVTTFQHLDVVSVDLHRKTQECYISQEVSQYYKYLACVIRVALSNAKIFRNAIIIYGLYCFK